LLPTAHCRLHRSPGIPSVVRAVFLFCLIVTVARAKDANVPARTTAELQKQIEKVLKLTLTPGAGVAIVGRDGPEWVAGIGTADVAAKVPVTAATLFRIGSVSKGFVSLSVLKLQAEGRLGLQDTLRSRAPDLEFANRWEASDPVRIVNLLEHTSGWDDLALREYAFNPAKEMTLREGLAYNPGSRTSRWRPGTSYSYANSGPAAAAYVVEKVTGERFEDYVEETWFRRLKMNTASYFDTPEVEGRLTKLYHKDGLTPYPYWHIIVRPAGAINASATEMANYVQFYLNRGSFGGVQLLPREAIDRMELPTTTYAAREGLKTGYGLGNYAMVKDRWVFHGHEGGVEGGLTQLAYLPDAGVGYVFMINSSNGGAFSQISDLLRAYVTRDLAKPGLPPKWPVPPEIARDYAGWYEPISVRPARVRFLARILGLIRIIPHSEGGLRLWGIFGRERGFAAVTDRLYRRDAEAAPTLALIADRSEGTLIQVSGDSFRHIPSWLPWLEFSVIAAALLLMASSVIFALVWVPRKIFGDLRSVGNLSVRAMPVLATLSLLVSIVLVILTSQDPIERLGLPTFWSVGIFVSCIAFAVFALLGLTLAVRFQYREIRRLVWWHAFAASAVMTAVAMYLAYWGVVGWRSWA
jgi:CubicO group peptidase (beta-lactamase class C family)